MRWSTGPATRDVIEMDDVRAGHVVEGPAVIEAPATTFAVPPGRRAVLDAQRIFHLQPTTT